MRILHTSDWHLGKRLENFSRHDEQVAVMNEICEIADTENADVVLVAGDLFDTYNPPTEATELLYHALKRLSNNGIRPVVAIAGNHDSPDRIEAPNPLARECGILFAGYPGSEIKPYPSNNGFAITRSEPGFLEIALHDGQLLRLIITPYANEMRLRTFLGVDDSEREFRDLLAQKWDDLSNKYCNAQGVNLLMAHLLFTNEGDSIPEEPDDEKPILYIGGAQAILSSCVPSQIQYVALGHLHRCQKIQETPSVIRYSGSPLAYSFGEADQDKFVVMVDAEPGKPVSTRKVLLQSGRRLIRKRFEDIDQAVDWLSANTHVFVELTIVTETYLTAEERKRLTSAHERIVALVPEVKTTGESNNQGSRVNLDQNIDGLFRDFFKHRKGQEPNDRLVDLFHEILSEDEA